MEKDRSVSNGVFFMSGDPNKKNGNNRWDTQVLLKILEGENFPVNESDLFLDHDIEDFFNTLLKSKKMTKSDVVLRSNIEKSYAYQLLNGTRIAGRDYYLRIAVAMKLDVQTTQCMLAVVGVGNLHPLNRRDAAIIFALNHGYDSVETYELMQREGLSTLEQDQDEEDVKPTSCPDIDSDNRMNTAIMKNMLGGSTFPSREKATFLDSKIENFFERLFSQTSMKKAEVIQKSGLKSSYGYAIFQGVRLARAEYYLRIAIAMGLDLKMTQRLLSVAGVGCLHPLNYRDAAIIYCINQKYDNEQTKRFLQGLKLKDLEG